MRTGRPKKQPESFLNKKDYEKIIALYEEGASNVEIKAYIIKKTGTFSNDLWDRWLKEDNDFSKTIKKGLILSEAWWEEKGRKNLKDKDFNNVLWYMNMKNRFGWKDKQDITTNEQAVRAVQIYLPKEEES